MRKLWLLLPLLTLLFMPKITQAAFTYAWDETVPTNATFGYLIDDYMRQFNMSIRERLAIDHYFIDADTVTSDTIGFHRWMHLMQQSTDPDTIANVGILYQKGIYDGSVGDTIPTLYWRPSGVGMPQKLSSVATKFDITTTDTGTYTITEEQTISTDLTIPINVALTFEDGGVLTVDTGIILTINGSVSAGLYQIFNCIDTGKVVFGDGSVKEVYPQWWGAVGDATVDCTVPIQAAIDAVNTDSDGMKPIVFFVVGAYKITSPVTLHKGTRLLGSGNNFGSLVGGTRLLHVPITPVTDMLTLDSPPVNSDPYNYGVEIGNMVLQGVATQNSALATGNVLYLYKAAHSYFHDLTIIYGVQGMFINYGMQNRFERMVFYAQIGANIMIGGVDTPTTTQMFRDVDMNAQNGAWCMSIGSTSLHIVLENCTMQTTFTPPTTPGYGLSVLGQAADSQVILDKLYVENIRQKAIEWGVNGVSANGSGELTISNSLFMGVDNGDSSLANRMIYVDKIGGLNITNSRISNYKVVIDNINSAYPVRTRFVGNGVILSDTAQTVKERIFTDMMNFQRVSGYSIKGIADVSNGDTVVHQFGMDTTTPSGISVAPYIVTAISSNAGDYVSVTAITSTTFTVAIYTASGVVQTDKHNIYWTAE